MEGGGEERCVYLYHHVILQCSQSVGSEEDFVVFSLKPKFILFMTSFLYFACLTYLYLSSLQSRCVLDIKRKTK